MMPPVGSETPVSRSRRGAARIFEILALGALLASLFLSARTTAREGAFLPGVLAGLLLWVALPLIVATLLDPQRPGWARALAAITDPGRPAAFGLYRRLFRSTSAAAAGTVVALAGAWTFAHPFTDYLGGAALLGWGLALALGAGALFAWLGVRRSDDGPDRPDAPRLAALAGSTTVLLVAAWWNPGLGWHYPLSMSATASLLVATACGVACGLGLAVALGPGQAAKRAGLAFALLVVPIGVMFNATRPLPGTAEPESGWPHAVLLITIDTLRADHLGAYGYSRDTSPALDALAAESVLFEQAIAAMPTTDPSHVAILTGLFPRTTGVTRNGVSITGGEPGSLASWLQGRGYRTGAVTSRAHLDPRALRLPGFQTASVPQSATPAPEAHRRASSWIARHGDRPFFLWTHFWDPHAPYAPPPETASMFVRPGGAGFVHGMHPYAERTGLHPHASIRHAVDLYDAEIRYADGWVGRLIEETRQRFGRERVLVIVTSDHGETLDEQDDHYLYAFDHGKLLDMAELHVPLIVSWPGTLPEGLRVSTPVPTAGIAPTVAAVLGDEFRSDVGAFDDLLRGADGPVSNALLIERRAFDDPVRVPFLGAPELGLVEGRWLYVENPSRGRFLHDLASDGLQGQNLADVEPRTVERLAARLRELAQSHPPAASVTATMDPATVETLKSLGYIQ